MKRPRQDHGDERRDARIPQAIDELMTVLEGEVEFEIEGRVYRPVVGEELLIPAITVHSARNVGTTTSRWLYGYKR